MLCNFAQARRGRSERGLGGWRGQNERRLVCGSKASQLRESCLSDVPRIYGEAAEQVG
jgi:hypothetical protein